MRVIRLAAALALSVALPAAAEDLTIVSKVSGPSGPTTSTQYFSSSKFRSAGADHDTVFDTAGGTLTVIDNKKKEYWTTTLDEMNAMMSAASEQMKQMQEQLKGNPMAEKLLEKMGGGAGAGPAVQVVKGDKPRTIAGYSCDHYVVSMGTQIKMEMWTTSSITPPTAFWDARRAQMAANPMLQSWAKLFDELKKINGFTLAESTTMAFMGKSMETTTEATEVKKGAIPASAFEVPAGYKKVESPMKDAAAKMKGRPKG